MTTTTNKRTVTKADLAGGLAIVTIIIMGGAWLFYGAIIGAWLGAMATITLIGAGGAVAIALIYGAANGLLLTTKKAVDVGYHVAFLNEELAMKKANTLYRHAEIQQVYANSELVRAESISKQWAITEISAKRGAMVMINGVPTLIPPIQSSAPMLPLLAQGDIEIEWDSDKLFRAFRTAKSAHGLIIGSRNSGKTTFINALNNEVFSDYDVTIIDILFNKVESGWLLPDGARVSRDFVATLREFYTSHKKQADNATTKRIVAKPRILVIDEVPSLLATLKASDKKLYDDVMAMLRAIYSQGSHTQHNLILMSQTVLSEDIGLSNNDKQNFIQVCLGGLSGEFLALKRGKGDKARGLYTRLESVASETDYYSVFVDCNGAIDVQPLADLSQYGAKRLYGQVDSEAMREADIVPVANLAPVKPDSLQFIEMTDKEKSVIDLALQLENEGRFSIKLLHETLTGKQIGGKQSVQYKEILAKFGYLWLVEKTSTTVQ